MLTKIKSFIAKHYSRATCNHHYTDCFPGAANTQMTQCCTKCGSVTMNPFYSKLYLR